MTVRTPARSTARTPAHTPRPRAGMSGPTRRGQGRVPEHRGDTLTVLAGAVVAVLAGWVWASGEVAGWLLSGRWPRVGPASVPGIVGRLPRHLSDPRLAWPAPARGALPGPVGLAGCGLALVVLATVAWLGWRRWRQAISSAGVWRSRGGARWARRRSRSGARWATSDDLRCLRVREGREGARLVLGTAGRAPIATEARHSVLVVGPTQSGKSSGLAIPALLRWPGPVVATSVKDDLAATTLAWRSRQGSCWVFDPTATSGLRPAAGWSPLGECGDWSAAQRMAGWLVEAAPAREGLTDGAFWYAAAAKQVAPLLLAARRGGLTMADLVRWTNAGAFDEPGSLLEIAGDTEAAVALYACAARDERIRSSVATTLETVLAPFEDPTVAAATTAADIEPSRLLDGCNSLYLCGPSHEQHRVQGLFAALVSSVVAAAVSRANQSGKALDPPLLVVLDEVANIAPIRDLDGLASTGAALGVQLVTVCQDLSQLGARYGSERARTIANNHRAKLILSGVSDLCTLDLVSGLAGEQAVREETVTQDLRDGRQTRSSATVLRRLAPADEVRRICPGDALLIYGHLPPARVRLGPWYADRTLRARAGLPLAPRSSAPGG